ncbi:MAG: nicotinate phosphoribosyltransferase [Candidatus Omnitrophota bacterium]
MVQSDYQTAEGILFTDFYQLTMAQLYFKLGWHEKEVQFDYFFRNYPDYGTHQAGYCINAGLEWLLDWMRHIRFEQSDLELLKIHLNKAGRQIFDNNFIDWLGVHGSFDHITLWAIPEGRVVHANTPLAVVRGPFVMTQLLETSLLNHLNYQTLVATKAARIKYAGRNRPLIGFGMRRGQGEGVNAGTRAELIGGADFSSNTGMSYILGYPPVGTHAHSMIQAFIAMGEGELGAFEAYADLYPDDCVLLVDTVNTLESGLPNAIKVFEKLKRYGHEPAGIRLDSGDLAYLSIQAARMLDQAGFPRTSIVLSNQLDELILWQIINQIIIEAPRYQMDPDRIIDRLIFGVGTKLIVSAGAPALDGVYKLSAIKENGQWVPSLKISENTSKTLIPGFKHLFRIYDQRKKAEADVMTLNEEVVFINGQLRIHHSMDMSLSRIIEEKNVLKTESLLSLILENGKMVYQCPPIDQIRHQRDNDLACLDEGVKRIINPHRYHVSLDDGLWDLKNNLVKRYSNR